MYNIFIIAALWTISPLSLHFEYNTGDLSSTTYFTINNNGKFNIEFNIEYDHNVYLLSDYTNLLLIDKTVNISVTLDLKYEPSVITITNSKKGCYNDVIILGSKKLIGIKYIFRLLFL